MKLLALSGFVPEQICDITRFTGYEGERKINHYCSYASDFISQVLSDNTFDGAVFPRSCDSSRIMKSYLEDSDKFLYQLNIPARQDDLAVEYFAKEIENYRNAVEQHYQTKLEDIKDRFVCISRRNKQIYNNYKNLEHISYSKYLKALHRMLQKPLAEQQVLNHYEPVSSCGKRVYLIGSFLCDEAIAKMIEDSGMKIVGDNLPESGRLASAPEIPDGNDIYKGIAQSILSSRLSPSQNNFQKLMARDLEEIEDKDINGVIFVMQKYCEPYEYLYSVYKKTLDEKGIKSLKLSLSDMENGKNMALPIEAFSDTL